MSQQSTLRQSRQQWKPKAKARAEHNRSLRKALARIRQERDCATQALKEAQEPWRPKAARLATLTAPRGWLRLPLVVGARSSCRAVSRGLRGLAHGLGLGKAPGPPTVINWVMRLSVVRLQSFKLLQGAAKRLIPFTNGLIGMMDTSITRGTGKLLRVLALDAHHSQRAGGAPGFQHVRCVAVAGSPSGRGARRANRLDRVLSVVGRPGASRKDGGSALQKAVDVWSERGLGSPVMDDIAPAGATRLKRRDDTHPQCAPLLSAGGRVSRRLQQPVLAWLTPPTVHTTSRLMNVHCLVRGADRVLDLWPAGRATAGAVWANLRSGLDALPACRTLLRQWRDDAVALWACPKILKTQGLTPDTLTQGEPLRDPMASVRVRQEFSRYLQPQRETAQSFGLDAVGVPISSAPLASLFGLTPQHGVGPLKDAHRMALRLPALCGLPTEQEAPQVLAVSGAQQHARADGLSSFTKQRRPMRVHPHHLAQLGHGRAQGNVELIPPGKDRSNRSEIIYFPNGYKGVDGPAERGPKGPFPGRHEVSTTQVTVGVHQVQNPVKSRTPI